MLIILLACIYISFICLAWGQATYSLFRKITSVDEIRPHTSILCLLGLVPVLLISQLLSLFIPLGSWQLQLLFLLPAFIFLFRKSSLIFFRDLKNDFIAKKQILFWLSAVSIILLLVMSSWKIIHPDTLGYHAQIIQWIEKFKAVPGLVHLHPRFGFHSSWFAANAIFSFKFLENNNITFLNTTVLIWYLVFIFYKIDTCFRTNRNYFYGILWLLLFVFSLLSYTQLRLTATSASPDFITTLFIWSVILIFFEKKNNTKSYRSYQLILASLLSVLAVTLKLSAAPLLIIPAFSFFYFLKERKIKLLIITVSISVLTLVPFITRNIINSGYPLYPTTLLNIVDVDWKYDKELVLHEKDYITAFARAQSEYSKEEIERINKMNYSDWIPIWWSNQSLTDKTILILLIVSFVFACFRIKIFLSSAVPVKIILLTILAGIIFWFVNAPDPRFGFGFITGLIILIWGFFLPGYQFRFSKIILLALLTISLITVTAYSVYRFSKFYSPQQWLLPMGIEESNYTTTVCYGIKINSPLPNNNFGNIPVPCTVLQCDDFIPRGKIINRGFKAR